MRRIGSAFNNETSHLQQVPQGRAESRPFAPAMNGPVIPRPALVAGGSRVAMETRPQVTPRLRQVRSTDY
jgi:hypothetical protein